MRGEERGARGEERVVVECRATKKKKVAGGWGGGEGHWALGKLSRKRSEAKPRLLPKPLRSSEMAGPVQGAGPEQSR